MSIPDSIPSSRPRKTPNLRDVVAEVQSLGVRVPPEIRGRRGGAGPAEGRALLIEGRPVNAPISAPYVARSPYHLASGDDGFSLFRWDTERFPVRIIPEPAFYSRSTADGIPYPKIALLHGRDCLATTVLQGCVNWNTRRRCRFCGTGVSLRNGTALPRKRPDQLAEVARAARDSDGVAHVVLTSGTGDPPGSELPHLAACVRAVKAAAGLPVHVQFAPPGDPARMDELKASGADTVGIHVESFHPETLARAAPAKAALGMDRYVAAWRRAVDLFGPNQVSSFLIAGLGEPPASVVQGSEILADLGVYPYVVPLRPVPGSGLEHAAPPDPEIMKRIYPKVAEILARKGLSSDRCLAGCVRCGACSGLPLHETPHDRLVCHAARTQGELAEAMAIRREVFVAEQGLFSTSDRDIHDETAVHLVLEENGRIIGTVRAYRDPAEPGAWIGGRLAVRKPNRSFRAGRLLVKEAVRRVRREGAVKFTAFIQERNVPFFKKIGWRPVGTTIEHHGRPHQVMAANLDEDQEPFGKERD